MTPTDYEWIGGTTFDYFIAMFYDRNESYVATMKERFWHGIESLAQREYDRGFEDGMRIAGKEE